MKKIALLADGWKRLITYAWVQGINTFNEKHSEPIEICHYNCMGNWSDDLVFQVSIGTCIMAADTPDKQKSLQDYLNMADQSMYENKRKKRTT